MKGKDVAKLHVDYGGALQCGLQTLGTWLAEAHVIFQDWKRAEVPVARKEARKRKSRLADAQEKEVHEDVIVAMSLELRASMDTMTTERLPRHLAAKAVIAKYRALHRATASTARNGQRNTHQDT
jgi:hypothetical protein